MADEQEKVMLPLGRGIPVLENVQTIPTLGELAYDSVTVPESPPAAVTVIFVNGFELIGPERLDGVAVIEKDGATVVTVTLITVEFAIAPLVPPTPLTVTKKVPAEDPEKLQLPVAVPPAARVREAGHVTVNPPPTIVRESVTFPTNPAEPTGRL